MKTSVNEVLNERGSRYGAFSRNARMTQNLKHVLHEVTIKEPLPDYQQEAIDMIFHKIARVVCGDRTYEDNWVDIIGYAELALNELKQQPRPLNASTY